MSSSAELGIKVHELCSVGGELLHDGQSVSMRMGGYSMFPMLLPGDVATIDPLSIVALRPGDIVVFDRGDKWVAHRLTVIDNPEGKVLLVTQGDSCTSPDASFGQNEYRGVIRVVSRNGREIEQRHGAFVRLLLLRGNLIRPLIRACVRTMALWRAVMRRLR